MWMMYIVAAAMFTVGFCVVFFGTKKRSRCTVATRATVCKVEIDRETDEDGHSRNSYTPTFEYAVNGETYRRKGGVYSNRRRTYREGDVKNIKYNPDKPEEFVVEGAGGMGGGIFLMVLSVVIFVVLIIYG